MHYHTVRRFRWPTLLFSILVISSLLLSACAGAAAPAPAASDAGGAAATEAASGSDFRQHRGRRAGQDHLLELERRPGRAGCADR